MTVRLSTAKARLWERGEIRWKLKPCQVSMLERILASTRFKYVIKCARRLGKSYLLCSLAVMTCLQRPGAQVRYAAPTGKALRKIVRPIMAKILADCPPQLRPRWRTLDQCYVFPNGRGNPKDPYEGGSTIHLAGVNGGRADDLRGTECDLFIVDEARDIDELHYLVHDVAIPQFLDTDGRIVAGRRLVVASSPASSAAHEFSTMSDEAKEEGCYSHFDIFAGGYSPETIRMFFKEDGLSDKDVEALLEGRHEDISNNTVKREYLALDVIDQDVAVVPEWMSQYVQERPPTEFDKFYHRYMFLDIGIQQDLTVVLFALYDFMKGYLHVEDELVITGPKVTTPVIAKMIEGKLLERAEYKDPYRRISDNSHPLLLNDLSVLHNISFSPTTKDRLNEMVNYLRKWVADGRVTIHPRCVHTIGSISSAVWNRNRTQFDRSRVYGHYDAVAALVYGVRGVDEQTNPIPRNYGVDRFNTVIFPGRKRMSSAAKAFADAFGLRRDR